MAAVILVVGCASLPSLAQPIQAGFDFLAQRLGVAQHAPQMLPMGRRAVRQGVAQMAERAKGIALSVRMLAGAQFAPEIVGHLFAFGEIQRIARLFKAQAGQQPFVAEDHRPHIVAALEVFEGQLALLGGQISLAHPGQALLEAFLEQPAGAR